MIRIFVLKLDYINSQSFKTLLFIIIQYLVRIVTMNRFRVLKENLINSKRDSQKLEDKQVQQWLNQELDYYGILKDNYKITRSLQTQQKNHNQNNSQNKIIKHNNDAKQFNFIKKIKPFEQLTDIIQQSNDHLSSTQANKKKILIEPRLSNQPDTHLKSVRPSYLEEGQTQNQQFSSMKLQQIIQNKQKQSIQADLLNHFQMNSQITFQNNQISDIGTKRQIKVVGQNVEEASQKRKQRSQFLDYYSLIMQLTNELQYCRMNNQKKNQKSILKQLKNLIQFIQSQVKTPYSSINQLLQLSGSNKQMRIFNQNAEYEKEDDINIEDLLKQKEVERQIKYKIIKKQKSHHNSLNSNQKSSQHHSSRHHESNATYKQHQHLSVDANELEQSNKTFASQQIFDESTKKRSIIEFVQCEDMEEIQQFYSGIKTNQRIFSQSNSMAEDSPLSKITEHESEYKTSANPTPSNSPPKINRSKHENLKSLLDEWLNQQQKQEIEFTKCKNRTGKTQKYQKTNQTNLFQESLQYKKIQYMLDSEDGSIRKSQSSQNRSSRFNSSQGSYQYCQKMQNQYQERGNILIKKKTSSKIKLNEKINQSSNSKYMQKNSEFYQAQLYKQKKDELLATLKEDQSQELFEYQPLQKFDVKKQLSSNRHSRSRTTTCLLPQKNTTSIKPYTIKLQQLKKQIQRNFNIQEQIVNQNKPSSSNIKVGIQNSQNKKSEVYSSNKSRLSKYRNFLSKGSSNSGSSSKGNHTSSMSSNNSPKQQNSSTSFNQVDNGLQKSKCSRKSGKSGKSSRSIKYKVYTAAFQNENKVSEKSSIQKLQKVEKNQKQKVLSDIVNLLNTKYQKNINLKAK